MSIKPWRLPRRFPLLLAVPFTSGALFLVSCSTLSPTRDGLARQGLASQQLQVVFKGGRAYAQQGDERWVISEVTQDQMVWSPEASRFAFLKAPNRRQGNHRQGNRRQGNRLVHQLVIRTLRGDTVNEFPVYRAGRPSQLEWLDEHHISYLSPAGKGGRGADLYVIHAVDTAKIVRIHRGSRFSWSPRHRHLAYVRGQQPHSIEIDGRSVWPSRASRLRRRDHRVIGSLVWSPDGRSLSFLELENGRPHLVVLLELDDPDGHLVWALPPGAASPQNRIFWGDSRVVIGQSMLKPRYAASWQRVR